MDGNKTEIATLAGGCFWCLEAVYEEIHGIYSVVSGYCGGNTIQPTYYQVCSETTGHAEAVQLTFNPEEVTYEEIINVFFAIHDPTTLNRQGYDVGARYRSAVFYHNEIQKASAHNAITAMGKDDLWENPIVTEVVPARDFYPAETEHQQYYRNNTYQPYCQMVISPKLAKFRKEHLGKLKSAVSNQSSS